MGDSTSVRTPRQRYREQTRNEAKRVALDQLAAAGPSAISLNAVARRMGITGPALYRYFTGRDALVAELAAEAGAELAAVIEEAARRHHRKAPARRFREMADELRAWALSEPHRYLLIFSAEAAQDVHRCVTPFFDVLAELMPTDAGGARSTLDRQLAAWSAEHQRSDLPIAVLRQGVRALTRLHGLLSLEVQGQFAGMTTRPELLFRSEVDSVLAGPWQ